MDNSKRNIFNRIYDWFWNRPDKIRKPNLYELYEKRISDLEKVIEIQKSEIRVLRQERKRLLDRFFEPIPDYEQEKIGEELGQEVDWTSIDVLDLQAGTIMESETQ